MTPLIINPLKFPYEYFLLQTQFAYKHSTISNEPIGDSILRRTAIVKVFTGKKYTTGKDYLAILNCIKNSAEETTKSIFEYYVNLPKSKYIDREKRFNDPQFGSFTYEIQSEGAVVHVHYRNLKRGEKSNLSRVAFEERKYELQKMFKFILDTYPTVKRVIGNSWLYNLETYRNLFPPAFTKSMKPIPYNNAAFTNMYSIWGQFLNSRGYVKIDLMEEFLLKVKKAKTINSLNRSFKYRSYMTGCSFKKFKEFYGLED